MPSDRLYFDVKSPALSALSVEREIVNSPSASSAASEGKRISGLAETSTRLSLPVESMFAEVGVIRWKSALFSVKSAGKFPQCWTSATPASAA